MDGFGVQDVLTSGATFRPVIFLTGYGDIPASVKAMKSGAVDFLTKPVDADRLPFGGRFGARTRPRGAPDR